MLTLFCRGYIVEIKRLITQFNGIKGSAWSRIQYPLRLAYAVTNYKCQGLTLHKVVCHFNKPRRVGSLYTPLSRVPDPANISVVLSSVKDIIGHRFAPRTDTEFKLVTSEYRRLKHVNLTLQTVSEVFYFYYVDALLLSCFPIKFSIEIYMRFLL